MSRSVQEKAQQLAGIVFTGGPADLFEMAGRLQLITLLRCGLYPGSTVLDIGCGALRGGYWLIHFLEPNCYFGIEPNKEMLEAGKSEIVGTRLLEEKQPRFVHNDDFDPSAFRTSFDFFLARSIWSHASKSQICGMLDSFTVYGKDDAMFLTSYNPGCGDDDYRGDNWVGFSHESDVPGMVYHSFEWIRQECERRNLKARELPFDKVRQTWIAIGKGDGFKAMDGHLAELCRDPRIDISGREMARELLRRIVRR